MLTNDEAQEVTIHTYSQKHMLHRFGQRDLNVIRSRGSNLLILQVMTVLIRLFKETRNNFVGAYVEIWC